MSLYTVDIQMPRKKAGSVLRLFEPDAGNGVDLISSNLLYADIASAYYRLELFTSDRTRTRLESLLLQNGEDVQFKIREDITLYENPLVEVTATRNIDFKKSFVATAPQTVDLAQAMLYPQPRDVERLSRHRLGLISSGSLYEQPHRAALLLERDAYLVTKHANVQGLPLWFNSRNEEELIRAVQALSRNFYALRISGLHRDYAMEVVERLDELVELPVLHAESMERPVLMAAILRNAARVHGIALDRKVGAIIGLGPEGVGLLQFLLGFGFSKVYGIDADLRHVSQFEKKGGIASSIDHIYESADCVIVSPDYPVKLDEQRLHAGQLILSFSNNAFALENLKAGVGDFCYQSGQPHPVFVLPGLAGALARRRPDHITQDMLMRLLDTLITKTGDPGLLPVPSQELFRSQFEALG